MLKYRDSVQEYMRASEIMLLQAAELTEQEMIAVEGMLGQLSEMIRISKTDSNP